MSGNSPVLFIGAMFIVAVTGIVVPLYQMYRSYRKKGTKNGNDNS